MNEPNYTIPSDMNALALAASSSSTSIVAQTPQTILAVNQNLRQQFQYALSCLPIEMQRLFVERLISMVSNPEAVSVLASAAAWVEDDSNGSNSDMPLQFAVATLGTFLTQYAKTKNDGSRNADGNHLRSSSRKTFLRQLE